LDNIKEENIREDCRVNMQAGTKAALPAAGVIDIDIIAGS